MKFEDIKEFTYTQNSVTVDGEEIEVATTLDASITFVQYHRGRDVLEEPLMTVVPKAKYESMLEEWVVAKANAYELANPVLSPEVQAAKDYLELNAVTLNELTNLDNASIRDIREWIASQPTASQELKDREAQAILTRAQLI